MVFLYAAARRGALSMVNRVRELWKRSGEDDGGRRSSFKVGLMAFAPDGQAARLQGPSAYHWSGGPSWCVLREWWFLLSLAFFIIAAEIALLFIFTFVRGILL